MFSDRSRITVIKPLKQSNFIPISKINDVGIATSNYLLQINLTWFPWTSYFSNNADRSFLTSSKKCFSFCSAPLFGCKRQLDITKCNSTCIFLTIVEPISKLSLFNLRKKRFAFNTSTSASFFVFILLSELDNQIHNESLEYFSGRHFHHDEQQKRTKKF